ncbi:MAG: NUDIX domain-containing protein [Patescibacteria group bacterium]|nr:NUDIX domain-containing protein [Patescibacteria group bacterium]
MGSIKHAINRKKLRPRILLVGRLMVLNKKKEFLVVQRSSNDRYRPGMWELPGGKLDEGQDVSDTLHREVLEETSLKIKITVPLVYYQSGISKEGKYKGLTYVRMFGIAECLSGNVVLSHEHENFAWIEMNSISKYEITSECKQAIEFLNNREM